MPFSSNNFTYGNLEIKGGFFVLKDLQELDFECRVLQGFKLNRKGRINVVKFSLGILSNTLWALMV